MTTKHIGLYWDKWATVPIRTLLGEARTSTKLGSSCFIPCHGEMIHYDDLFLNGVQNRRFFIPAPKIIVNMWKCMLWERRFLSGLSLKHVLFSPLAFSQTRWWQLKDLLFSPLKLGKWFQFDEHIFSNWVGTTTNQLSFCGSIAVRSCHFPRP